MPLTTTKRGGKESDKGDEVLIAEAKAQEAKAKAQEARYRADSEIRKVKLEAMSLLKDGFITKADFMDIMKSL